MSHNVCFIVSLFSFCLDKLSIGESEVLKSYTINVWDFMCVNLSNVSLINVMSLYWGIGVQN